jgi:hypothetical protein
MMWLHFIIGVFGVLIFARELSRGWRTGEVSSGKGWVAHRDEQPILFWMCMAVQLIFLGASLWFVSIALARWIA